MGTPTRASRWWLGAGATTGPRTLGARPTPIGPAKPEPSSPPLHRSADRIAGRRSRSLSGVSAALTDADGTSRPHERGDEPADHRAEQRPTNAQRHSSPAQGQNARVRADRAAEQETGQRPEQQAD